MGTFYAIDLTVSVDGSVTDENNIQWDDEADVNTPTYRKDRNHDRYKNKNNNKGKKNTNKNNKPSQPASTPVQPDTLPHHDNDKRNNTIHNNNNSTSNKTALDRTTEQVSLLKSLLREEKISSPIILVGHYYGARVALELAKAVPESVKEIILIAPNLNRKFVTTLPSAILNKRTLFFWVKTDPLSSFSRFTGYKDLFKKHTLMAFDPPGRNSQLHTLELLMTEKYQERIADWIDGGR